MEPGAYTSVDVQNDFSPLRFWRGAENIAVRTVGGDERLDVSLDRGCYTTGADHGCAMQARSVLPGQDAVTMEYTCARPLAPPRGCT